MRLSWACGLLGEVSDQVGLDDNHRAFAFRHRIEGRLEFRALFRGRLNPDHRNPSLRQGLDAVRQVFPHLRPGLERADDGQLAAVILQRGVLEILASDRRRP